MRAWLGLRPGVHYRREAFTSGLEKLGYRVIHEEIPRRTGDRDVLVIWNRYRGWATAADQFESRGQKVLVAENAAWGNSFAGAQWYSLAHSFHNTAGRFPVGGNERWDSLGVELAPWRTSGETVVLPQRGIGPPQVAMPHAWLAKQAGRVRPHPGTRECVPLDVDLAKAGKVVTWGSGAAIKALTWGIPVESHMPGWIGEQDNTDAGRLAMFRRLAWAQWRLSEITNGDAFRWLLR